MSPAEKARFRAMIDQHFDVIWRSLRRVGIPKAEMDDCMQQVFLVASRKLPSITAGSEQAFLLGTALRVASEARRTRERRREVPEDVPEEDSGQHAHPSPLPDDLTDQKRLRELLDEVLEAMPMDLRSVLCCSRSKSSRRRRSPSCSASRRGRRRRVSGAHAKSLTGCSRVTRAAAEERGSSTRGGSS
jgi:DNA-directed RNA polymerase specialized sigma24 family protein